MGTDINKLLDDLFNASFASGWHAAEKENDQHFAAMEKANEIREEILQWLNESGITVRFDKNRVSGKLTGVKVDNL